MKKKKQEAPVIPEKFEIIGADLSLNRPGFCVLTVLDGKISDFSLCSVDNKKNAGKKPRGAILKEIGSAFVELLKGDACQKHPVFLVREASVNNSTFGRRSGTAARTGISEVVGVMDLMAYTSGLKPLEWDEIYPVSIKKAVAGSGKAQKEEVASAVKEYLPEAEFKNDDESDAAAVALAWLLKNKIIEPLPGSAARESAA